MRVYSEKQLFKKLAVFSSIFVADTKIFSDYNFVAPLIGQRHNITQLNNFFLHVLNQALKIFLIKLFIDFIILRYTKNRKLK